MNRSPNVDYTNSIGLYFLTIKPGLNRTCFVQNFTLYHPNLSSSLIHLEKKRIQMKQTYVFSAQKTRHETFQQSAMLESALSLSI